MNNHLVTIPNNAEGKTFIKVLRQNLRNTPHGVMVRGRGPRKPHVGIYGKTHSNLRQDLPLSVSVRLSVYITDKPKYRVVKQTKTVSEWVRVPTKWAKLSV